MWASKSRKNVELELPDATKIGNIENQNITETSITTIILAQRERNIVEITKKIMIEVI